MKTPALYSLLTLTFFMNAPLAKEEVFPFKQLTGEDRAQLSEVMSVRQECATFKAIATNKGIENPINIDQIQVYKGGYRLFESYRQGIFDEDTTHVMMSASKPVTATILDAAIEQGLQYQVGAPLTYETKLNDIYPYENIKGKRKGKDAKKDESFYKAITVRDITGMHSGIKWLESYNAVNGDFMRALYGSDRENMLEASLRPEMEIAPGKKFNYSGGNANILQGIIRKIGKIEFASDDPNLTAHKILFSRLGIKKEEAFFELDRAGNAVGSTYLNLTPNAMARLGMLYLHQGKWQGQKLLSDYYLGAIKRLNAGIKRYDREKLTLSAEYLKYIEEEGTPSDGITWLNQDIYHYVKKGDKLIRQIAYAKEFPHSPDDMYFLAGHNGQLIFILPSQDMVLVTTGQNRSYWDKIDKLISNSVACFGDREDHENLSFAPDKHRSELRSALEDKKKSSSFGSFTSKIKGGLKMIPALGKLYFSALPSSVAAKELCSCIVNSFKGRKFTKEAVKKAINYCPGDIPKTMEKHFLTKFFERTLDNGETYQEIAVSRIGMGFKRFARIEAHYGCRLLGKSETKEGTLRRYK